MDQETAGVPVSPFGTLTAVRGDHNPPHFHVHYAGHKARVALDGSIWPGIYLEGQEDLVTEWADLHPDELEDCWERAVNHEPPGTIDPLP